jgi:membrane protease YdiL (CAAX protease family)
VHAVALSFPALIVVNLWFTLSFGLGNLASIAQAGAAQGQPAVTLPGVWFQEVMLAVMGLIGVGWLSRRSLAETLQRLGIVAPSARQVARGFGLGLLMVPIVLAIEYAGSRLGIGVSNDVQRLSEQLTGPLGQSIAGILTLGLAAGLGEETIFRGALQPRFGLLLTALLFALLHSTYGLSLSTVVVFLLGLVLGLVRIRANTTRSMVVHATYNMTLGLLTYLGLFQNF